MEKISHFDDSLISDEVLAILLTDKTTGENIIWATDDYAENGDGFGFKDKITVENCSVIKPRIEKTKDEQKNRSKDKAEVFTPSWVCNVQNNQIDRAWFEKERGLFNTETENGWITYPRKIIFQKGLNKTWQDYVKANRLEITCGEAPYITSRYDTVTGEYIEVKDRIGLLDRKLRIISENVDIWQTWIKWAKIAVQSTYGFEWQGDNLLLARKNILLTVIEHYYAKFNRLIGEKTLLKFAEIIIWNVFQMDGIKFVVPNTCHEVDDGQLYLGSFVSSEETVAPCPGCKSGNNFEHNGKASLVKDWQTGEITEFRNIVKG